MDEVAAWIYKEMRANSTGAEAKAIRGDYTIAGAMYDFYKLVRTGGAWDHKGQITKKFKDWSCDYSTKTAYRFDIWSNVHYGYIGRSVGFDRWTLEAGAGAAQASAGTSPDGYWSRRQQKFGDADVLSALDDPLDLGAIRLGMDLWDAHRDGLTLAQLVAGLRAKAKANGLAVTACQAMCKIIFRCPKPIIVIDPGHGIGSKNVGGSVLILGKDGKTHGQDPKRNERDLVMKVSEALKKELENRGYTVYITRTSENYVKHDKSVKRELDDRVLFSARVQPDYYLSIHADGGVTGKESGSHAVYRTQGVDKARVPGLVELAEDIMSNYKIVPVQAGSPKIDNKLRVLAADNRARRSVLVELGFGSSAGDWDTLNKGAAQAAAQLAMGLDVNIERHRAEFNSVERAQPF